MEVEKIKKSEISLDIENLRANPGVIDASINNRIQEIKERISDAEDSIENIDTTFQKKCTMQKSCNPKHPGTPGHNEKTKPKDYRNRRKQGFTS